MKNLWAPWRMRYIEKESRDEESGCLFCPRIESDEDEKNLIVGRTGLSVVFMNKYPYNGGHVLVMPKRHLAELGDLEDGELFDLFDAVRKMRDAIDSVMKPHGYNVGINLGEVAGAGVPGHLHVHLVPRWKGDTNFMPLFGEVHVISEHIEATRAKLSEAFAKLTEKE